MPIKDLKLQKVLLIEDFPSMSAAIKTMLFSIHLTNITEVTTGMAAIHAMEGEQFDIILCDYNLGRGKNGLQVLEESRERKLLRPHTAFIIVTAENIQSMVLGLVENNPDDYLSKPFTAQLLLTRIQRAFEHKEFFKRIDEAIFEDNYPLAIEFCDLYLRRKKSNKMHSALLRKRAELALYMLDYEMAQNIYRTILKKRELSWAMIGLAVTFQHQEKHHEAIKLFLDIIHKYPMKMQSYDLLALSYEAIDEHSNAQHTLHDAVKLSPNILKRQRNLAYIAKKTGDWYAAEAAEQSVLSLGKYSIFRKPTDFSNLAQTLDSLNKTIEAIEVLKTLIKEFPNDPSVELLSHITESEIFYNSDDIELSEHAFIKALDLKQHQNTLEKESKLSMAKVCHINHRDELANDILDDLISNHIDDNEFITDLNNMNRSLGHEDLTDNKIDIARKQMVETNNEAISLFKKGKINDAIAILIEAFKKTPDNKTIILNIIKILLHQIKISKPTTHNMKNVKFYIEKARAGNVAQNKLNRIQMEYAKLMHQLKQGE